MKIKHALGKDRTAVIAVKGKRLGFTVVAPACARAVGLHLNGVARADCKESVLIGNRTVIKSKFNRSVVIVVVWCFILISKANFSTSCFTGGAELTVKKATAVCYAESLGKLALDNLAPKIVGVIAA